MSRVPYASLKLRGQGCSFRTDHPASGLPAEPILNSSSGVGGVDDVDLRYDRAVIQSMAPSPSPRAVLMRSEPRARIRADHWFGWLTIRGSAVEVA